MTGTVLKGLALGAIPPAGAAYYLNKNPDAARSLSQHLIGDDYKVERDYGDEKLWDKTKRIGGDLASNPNTYKALSALALASALGYGTYKMGENDKMKQLERAALGMR